MPWTASDAHKHTHLAKTAKARRQWAHVSNSVLKHTGDEARAIAAANAVVGRRKDAKKKRYTILD